MALAPSLSPDTLFCTQSLTCLSHLPGFWWTQKTHTYKLSFPTVPWIHSALFPARRTHIWISHGNCGGSYWRSVWRNLESHRGTPLEVYLKPPDYVSWDGKTYIKQGLHHSVPGLLDTLKRRKCMEHPAASWHWVTCDLPMPCLSHLCGLCPHIVNQSNPSSFK